MAIFITLGVVGLVLLVLSFIFDGLLDAFDFDFGADGILSVTSVLGFISAFGFAGWLSLSAISDSFGVAVLVGIVAGVVVGVGTGLAMRYLKNSETGSVDRNDLVGEVGTALHNAAANTYFEFMVYHHGMRSKITAFADVDVKRGQQLKITNVVSSTQVQVTPVLASSSDTTTEKE